MTNEVHHSHAVWVVVDGAMLDAADMQALQHAYGLPLRAFEATELAAYEEMGLLLWPWHVPHGQDELAVLATVVGARPAVSFVRADAGDPRPLSRMLAWMVNAETSDRLPLYFRVGDTRVLGSFLRHLRHAQQAHIGTAIHEWVWPDRNGLPLSMVFDAPPGTEAEQGHHGRLVLDDPQYAALLDDAAVDMFHARLRHADSVSEDRRSAGELHEWLQQILARVSALGITRQRDQVTFALLALRVPGPFENLLELGETWLRVRGGTTSLDKEMLRWGDRELKAINGFRSVSQ